MSRRAVLCRWKSRPERIPSRIAASPLFQIRLFEYQMFEHLKRDFPVYVG